MFSLRLTHSSACETCSTPTTITYPSTIKKRTKIASKSQKDWKYYYYMKASNLALFYEFMSEKITESVEKNIEIVIMLIT